MKKIFVVLFVACCSLTVFAQSGRRIKTPPPVPVQESVVVDPPIAPSQQSNRRYAAPEEMVVLPQNLVNRRIQLVDGGNLRFADYDDKVIVINLWATWCGPCRQEIPDYEKVRKEYAGRRVEFIALTSENPNTSTNRVKKFVRDYNFGWRIGWADRETEETIINGSNAIPQTLVIAPGGRIIAHWRGSSSQSGDRLRKAIERALTE